MATPTIADFKAFFVREFRYGTGFDTVMDADITRGLNEAGMVFNSALWANAQEMQTAYLYASAHFLTLNIQSAGGLSANVRGKGVDSHGGGTIESKAVGNVNVGLAIPDFVRQSPILSQFMRTDFGQTYIALITPRLVGNVAVIAGGDSLDGAFGGAVAPLVISTSSLPSGTVSTPYSTQIVALGGLVPLTWSIQTGSLPTGLSLSSSGLVSGTPTGAGTYTFRARVVDGQQTAAGQNYTVVIAP